MKRCPECRRDYYDETLLYCLDDGTPLLEGPGSLPSGDEPRTAILGRTGESGESPTKIQPNSTAEITDPKVSRPALSRAKIVALGSLIVIAAMSGVLGYRYFSKPSSKQIESIAVMPFVNDGGSADVDYLSDGMTETLIASLSQLPNLSVKARSSVFRYKGKDTNPHTVGKELGVQAILNGHVVQRGDLLILSLELIDAVTENVIWSQLYNRKQSDLITLQTEIASDVSNKLRTKITGEQKEQLAKKYTDNPEAYKLYLQGRYYWNKRKRDELAKAVQYFEQAIVLDPNYALAYAGIADCYAVEASPVKGPEQDVKLRAAANKAIELDNTLGQPHAALANTYWDKHDWQTAEGEYRTAIELAPDYASAHQWYGEMLTRLGHHDEAIAEIRRARDLDPLSLVINSDMIYILAMARRYDEGIEQARKTIEMDKSWTVAYWHLVEIYQFQGEYERSLDEEENAAENSDLPAEKLSEAKLEVAKLREAFRKSGAEGLWRLRLEFEKKRYASKEGSAKFIAEIYTYLGNKDEAFKWIATAIDEHEETDLVKVWPSLDPLRDDPRYKDVLKRLNLPE